jgi:pyridoxamine-phosphate oxidase
MSTGHGPTPSINFDTPPTDPFPILDQWLAEAMRLPTPNPNAMTLATIDSDGAPSARIVLLRGFSQDGARFFTNRNSRKGRALAANARAALLFHWDLLDRQVRIEGRVSLATDAESDEYFAQRPVDSRVNAWASDQSEPVASRAELERRAAELTASSPSEVATLVAFLEDRHVRALPASPVNLNAGHAPRLLHLHVASSRVPTEGP